MTTLPDAVSEAIIALYSGIDLYVSLHSADPGKTGASEITGTSYARQLVPTSGGWSAAAADVTSGGRNESNVAAVDFGTAGSAWGTITHFAVWTAVTAGTFKGGAALTASQTIASGNAVSFPIGDLVIVGAGF
jgi:hypothetical protein